jgi:hypothetical protein
MAIVGWQPQRAITDYRTEEIIYIYIYICIYRYETLQLPDIRLTSLHSTSVWLYDQETKLHHSPTLTLCFHSAEFQSSQRRTKHEQLGFVLGDEGKATNL